MHRTESGDRLHLLPQLGRFCYRDGLVGADVDVVTHTRDAARMRNLGCSKLIWA
jgi:hypothetical protein